MKNGLEVTFEAVTFLFICSDDEFIKRRVSGAGTRFWGLCELFKETEC
jgi:hypothetical protein